MDSQETDTQSNALWSAEAKTARQWITDMFTRVHAERDVPADAIFGPCELKHTSVYDSIAFIALKSMDRRTAPYIIKQVDTSVDQLSAGGPVWLRLVQSARCAAEQNLSAYVKNGQLFYRALRAIERNEELLVWYSRDLAELLLLAQSKGVSPYICPHCNQHFESEFPFLAHQRFLCIQRSNSPQQHTPPGLTDYSLPGPKDYTSHAGKPESRSSFKRSSPGDGAPRTDFHNLARDVERRTEARSRNLKRKHFKEEEEEEEEEESSCNLQPSVVKLSLQSRGGGRGGGGRGRRVSSLTRKSGFCPPPTQSRSSFSLSLPAFPPSFPQPLRPSLAPALVPAPAPALAPVLVPRTPLGTGPRTLALGPPRGVPPLYSAALSLQTRTQALLPQLQAPPPLLLPSPLRLHAQNWCARCSLTFRLTSDLVAHMRIRHQGAPPPADPGARSPCGEERRHSCPICREVFKQRHHLARHMSAHTRSPSF